MAPPRSQMLNDNLSLAKINAGCPSKASFSGMGAWAKAAPAKSMRASRTTLQV
jgi:hypothetical protein